VEASEQVVQLAEQAVQAPVAKTNPAVVQVVQVSAAEQAVQLAEQATQAPATKA